MRQARREANQEKQAKKVITWIFVALIILALVFLVAASLS
jgi:flagellar basal body-associated protein FliL